MKITLKMIAENNLFPGHTWNHVDWFRSFKEDFPDGVEVSLNGWFSLIENGYHKILSVFRYMVDSGRYWRTVSNYMPMGAEEMPTEEDNG